MPARRWLDAPVGTKRRCNPAEAIRSLLQEIVNTIPLPACNAGKPRGRTREPRAWRTFSDGRPCGNAGLCLIVAALPPAAAEDTEKPEVIRLFNRRSAWPEKAILAPVEPQQRPCRTCSTWQAVEKAWFFGSLRAVHGYAGVFDRAKRWKMKETCSRNFRFPC
jgi:hypothetical protein